MRTLLVVLLLLALLPGTATAQATCGFQLGFKLLADQIPELVGQCLEDEHFNTANGNAEQRTTAWHGKGGLLVWRKSDNWTAFTDGNETWVNGPFGLRRRLNAERFDWEQDGPAPAGPAGGYSIEGPLALRLSPPPGASFEFPPWVVTGPPRELIVATEHSYLCRTPANLVADAVRLLAADCDLKVGPGNADWVLNYGGLVAVINLGANDRLLFIAGENKNECFADGHCVQNTVNPGVPYQECASHRQPGAGYSDCFKAYYGFVSAVRETGGQRFDLGPIAWPSAPYLAVRNSNGLRHPSVLVVDGFMWLFVQEASPDTGNRGRGIKLYRAPISSGGAPGAWTAYCDGTWVEALPRGFSAERIGAFYTRPGGCASPVIPPDGEQVRFSVARTATGYLGVEERTEWGDTGWQLRLWRSEDLLHWRLQQGLVSRAGGWNSGELHLPVFLSADGTTNERVDDRGFYVIGTRNGEVRALRVGDVAPLAGPSPAPAPTPAKPPAQPPTAGQRPPAQTVRSPDGLVEMAFDGNIWMPGGDPPKGYTTTFTIPAGNPAPNCFFGKQAALYAGTAATGRPLADHGNGLRAPGQPGATYTVKGDPTNGGFAWRPSGC